MKCEEALLKIDAYINDSLSIKETEEFLAHIRECPECYDELETYYTINVGTKYLENENMEKLVILNMKPDIPARNICLLKRKGISLSIAASELERQIKGGGENPDGNSCLLFKKM